jgi:MFS transporter
VFRPYRELFAAPGGLAMSAAGLVARMPIAMVEIGIVILVAGATGSYGLAGAVSATYSLLQAFVAPLLSRLIDGLGQRRVVPPAVLVHAAALALLVVLAEEDAPSWSLFPVAGVMGSALPSVGSLVRARWTHLVAGTSRLHTAYAFESVVDEIIFVVGPVLTTVLATRVDRAAGLAAAGTFAVVGGGLFVAQRSTEPPASGVVRAAGRSVAVAPGMPAVLSTFCALGGVFGAMGVATIAFSGERGHVAAAGVVLGVYALGSLTAGIAYGALRWQAPLDRRLVVAVTAMGVGVVPLAFATSIGVLGALAFLAGLAISPSLIAGFGLAERLVPVSRLTEGLTWLSSALGVGVALGSALAGRVVDLADGQRAFLVPVGCWLAAGAVSTAGAGRLRRALADR